MFLQKKNSKEYIYNVTYIVCKRWFNERHRILYFNTDHHSTIIDEILSSCFEYKVCQKIYKQIVMNLDPNNNNKFVNLSQLLVSKIVHCLDDHLDKIVFTLVCKRWFNERHRILYFNTDHHLRIIDERYKPFIHLNSYKSTIIDQINRKNNCNAIYSCVSQRHHDYLINPEKLDDIDIDRYKSLNIDELTIGVVPDNLDEVKKLYQLVSDINIPKLTRVPTYRLLPENVRSISFYDQFDVQLEPGCFPPNLEKIIFSNNFNQPIRAGVLPNGLIKLVFQESFDQPIEPGVLPASLKVLRLVKTGTLYNHTFIVGSLPPNLKELELGGNDSPIDNGVLPLSLQTLRNVPLSWMPAIKSLTNLKTLSFYEFKYEDDDDEQLEEVVQVVGQLDLSCLPPSLTSLTVFGDAKLINVLPTSTRYLDLDGCEYDINSIFKDRSQYQLDYLKLNISRASSLRGLNIKHLEIDMQPEIEKEVEEGTEAKSNAGLPSLDIPLSVETLSIHLNKKIELKQQIPSSVKKLIVYGDIDGIKDLQHNNDMSIQELVVNFNVSRFDRRRQSNAIPEINYPSNTLFILSCLGDEKIFIRMIDDLHYLVFSQTPIMTAIVHQSQLQKYLLNTIGKYQRFREPTFAFSALRRDFNVPFL
ncbi:hypothetical protein PPL_01134 [Heterostelium album PN500]|uniref:COI1 F-box domain-containing protein n=1 Tax=Heterostelium pallidum (strain ATCC 26659 / Pp 5 / PN500) TaxID=670386 RepID=D3AY75_HETP5|nr:hypothetical protein PPL_01134 [Heterostelium album PN500]EFA85902.1 hypothetical protein PPL_01134 [Heterostelium album PN500]|eukprot:XP_020438008.1 hypothetical protein PPL_01134 [Heterostelium album PN500]